MSAKKTSGGSLPSAGLFFDINFPFDLGGYLVNSANTEPIPIGAGGIMPKAEPLEPRLPAALPLPWEMIVQHPECYPPAHEVTAVQRAAQQAAPGKTRRNSGDFPEPGIGGGRTPTSGSDVKTQTHLVRQLADRAIEPSSAFRRMAKLGR